MTLATTSTFAALWAFAASEPGPLVRVTCTPDGWLLGATEQAQGQFLGSVDRVTAAFRGVHRSGAVSRRQAERLADRFLARVRR